MLTVETHLCDCFIYFHFSYFLYFIFLYRCYFFLYDDLFLQTLDMCSLLHQIIIIDTLYTTRRILLFYRHDWMFLYGLRDPTQCILIDISILCYQFLVVIFFVDVKINLIQCQCQCNNFN